MLQVGGCTRSLQRIYCRSDTTEWRYNWSIFLSFCLFHYLSTLEQLVRYNYKKKPLLAGYSVTTITMKIADKKPEKKANVVADTAHVQHWYYGSLCPNLRKLSMRVLPLIHHCTKTLIFPLNLWQNFLHKRVFLGMADLLKRQKVKLQW